MFNITHAIATQDKSEIPTAYNMSIKFFNLFTLPRFHSETHIRITPMRYQTIKNVTITIPPFLCSTTNQIFNFR